MGIQHRRLCVRLSFLSALKCGFDRPTHAFGINCDTTSLTFGLSTQNGGLPQLLLTACNQGAAYLGSIPSTSGWQHIAVTLDTSTGALLSCSISHGIAR